MTEVSPEAISSQVQCQVPLNTVDYISLYLMVDADRIGEKLNPAEKDPQFFLGHLDTLCKQARAKGENTVTFPLGLYEWELLRKVCLYGFRPGNFASSEHQEGLRRLWGELQNIELAMRVAEAEEPA